LKKIYYLKWKTYVPSSLDNEQELFVPHRIKFARTEEFENFCKVVVSKEIFDQHSVKLSNGNHEIQHIKKIAKTAERKISTDICIAHYPIRSKEQLKSKILVGYINNLATYDAKPGEGWHLEVLLNKIKSTQNFSDADLTMFAKTYACDVTADLIPIVSQPINTSFCQNIQMRYTSLNEVVALKNFIENCELLAREHSTVTIRQVMIFLRRPIYKVLLRFKRIIKLLLRKK